MWEAVLYGTLTFFLNLAGLHGGGSLPLRAGSGAGTSSHKITIGEGRPHHLRGMGDGHTLPPGSPDGSPTDEGSGH